MIIINFFEILIQNLSYATSFHPTIDSDSDSDNNSPVDSRKRKLEIVDSDDDEMEEEEDDETENDEVEVSDFDESFDESCFIDGTENDNPNDKPGESEDLNQSVFHTEVPAEVRKCLKDNFGYDTFRLGSKN